MSKPLSEIVNRGCKGEADLSFSFLGGDSFCAVSALGSLTGRNRGKAVAVTLE